MARPNSLIQMAFLAGAGLAEVLKALEVIDFGAAEVYQYRELAEDLVNLLPQEWMTRERLSATANRVKDETKALVEKMKRACGIGQQDG